MYDKLLIQRVCSLTCTLEDVVREQTTIKYDNEQPFKKYYNVSSITGAIERYISGEWDDIMLAHWACIYSWILCGGFAKDKIDDLNSFERFFRNFITWDLDGLSFFSAEADDERDMEELIRLYKDYDHIWQTRDEWRCVYAMIGQYAKENGDQYVALINDTTREYMIMYSDHLENGYEDDHFRFVSKKEHLALTSRLKDEGYTLLPCSEDFYYLEANDT